MLSIFVYSTVLIGISAKLTVVPRNMAAMNGCSATMECATDNKTTKLMWRASWNNTSVLKSIYTGNKIAIDFNNFFEVSITTEGQFNLKIAVNHDTAMKYVCEEIGVQTASAELIVIDSDPLCTANRQAMGGRNILELQCTLTYWGNWEPMMEWHPVLEKGKDWSHQSIREHTKNGVPLKTLVSSLSIYKDRNADSYSCTTKFSASKRPNDTHMAANVPEYSFTWTYSATAVGWDASALVMVVVPCLCLLIITTIVSGLVCYIVRMKRKQQNNRPNSVALAIDTLTASKRVAVASESDYVEVPCAPVELSHGNSDFYTSLSDEKLTKEALYTGLVQPK